MKKPGVLRWGILLLLAVVVIGAALWLRRDLAPPPEAARMSSVHLELASLAASQGQHATAVAECQRALAADPRAPGVHRVLGYSLYRLKRFDEARPALEQAVSVKPDDGFAACFLGIVYAENPRSAAEEQRARELLEMAPRTYRGAEPWYGRGLLALRAGKPRDAAGEFRSAVKMDPGWESARYRLIEAYRLAGRQKEAEQEARVFRRLKETRPEFERLLHAVGQDPENHGMRLRLARLSLSTQRYREAMDHFQALTQRAASKEAFEGLAEAAEALGDVEVAKRSRKAGRRQ